VDPLRIGLVGDRSDAVAAHVAIPPALEGAGRRLGRAVAPVWVATDALPDDTTLCGFDGLWCIPASPYRDMGAALRAIRLARVEGIPFLGTCGGFQHALIEWARANGIEDAEHAETSPDAADLVIAPLACSLVEASGAIHLAPGSRAATLVGATQTVERYHCSYGLAPAFAERLLAGPLRPTGWDDARDVRVVELDEHPFFVASLFQPERSSSEAAPHGLVLGFVAAAGAHGAGWDGRSRSSGVAAVPPERA
jgi:CTP synthase (UTP-ammonia lyase)